MGAFLLFVWLRELSFQLKFGKVEKKEKKKFPLGFLFFSPSNDLFTNLMGKNRFCSGRLVVGVARKEREICSIFIHDIKNSLNNHCIFM